MISVVLNRIVRNSQTAVNMKAALSHFPADCVVELINPCFGPTMTAAPAQFPTAELHSLYSYGPRAGLNIVSSHMRSA